eukprot:m.493959 g.493959  ORF g.493959 m.493959 type:complete len:73 (-) comp38981_c0_seq1:25-243(-)
MCCKLIEPPLVNTTLKCAPMCPSLSLQPFVLVRAATPCDCGLIVLVAVCHQCATLVSLQACFAHPCATVCSG